MRPEEALAAARRAAASKPDPLAGDPGIPAGERVTRERLLEWALIEPDPRLVRSTRRAGAPITWAKRGLVRALRQHHGEAHAQQTRFNLHMVAAWTDLEARIAALEHEREPDRAPGG